MGSAEVGGIGDMLCLKGKRMDCERLNRQNLKSGILFLLDPY